MFKIVSMDWFPFIDFERIEEEHGTVVSVKDSLDVRMLLAVSKSLNFT